MSPTSWTEKTAPGSGWQEGFVIPPPSDDDLYIDVLFEGVTSGAIVSAWTERALSASNWVDGIALDIDGVALFGLPIPIEHGRAFKGTGPTTWTERTAS